MNLLRHRNITKLFGFGINANFEIFIVMEYLDGGSLDKGIAMYFIDYVE
jgi:serine/threonine protein kinase